MNHPNVHTPWSNWSESQTLYMVGVYSNPFRWRSRRTHFQRFVHHLRHTPNVELCVVECAYGARPFEVTSEIEPWDIQVRSNSEMFHKENLINIGVSKFPPHWQYGGYSDGDFHFTRHDWALEAVHMLQHHEFVQLFSNYVDVTAETSTSDYGHRIYRQNSSFAWNFAHQRDFQAAKMAIRKTDPYYGLPIPQATFPFGHPPGAPGGAWAWRKSAFDSVGGMLDTCIMGSGDWWMAFGLAGVEAANPLRGDATIRMYNDQIRAWQEKARKLTRNIGCVDQLALHFYHGASSNRAYGTRDALLLEHEFNPLTDLTRNWQGVYEWTGKPRLRDAVRRLFLDRREDDPYPA